MATSLKALRKRINSAKSDRGLKKLVTEALAQGEATFRYAQHCDWRDAVLAIGEARCYGALALDAINKCRAVPV
jgi:hypothetical protein